VRTRGPVGTPPELRSRLLLALVPVSTGAAVVVTILLWPDSLLYPALVLLGGTGATAVAVTRGLPEEARRAVRRRVAVGLVAGGLATAAYDVVRYGLVTLLSWSVDPFRPFTLFGQLLVGRGAPPAALWAAGIAYHIVNGLGFAVGYTIVVRRPGLVSAVVWALVLETFTILLYPDWLGITAVGEFFSMSMLGHLAYGLTLGAVAMRMSPATVEVRNHDGT